MVKNGQRVFGPEKLELIGEENFEILIVSIFRQSKSRFFQKQK